ncbi:hypothetical protein GCM10027428_35510 [Haliea atlantica]
MQTRYSGLPSPVKDTVVVLSMLVICTIFEFVSVEVETPVWSVKANAAGVRSSGCFPIATQLALSQYCMTRFELL